jgi:REP element-mobilizing transposase RayT
MDYKSNRNVFFSCKYHGVFCPKYRRKVLVHGVDARLKEIVRQVMTETKSELLEMEVMPDHVHLLVEIDRSLACTGSEGRERAIVEAFARRIPLAEVKAADALDQLLFRLDGRWRSAGGDKAVHREPEACLSRASRS